MVARGGLIMALCYVYGRPFGLEQPLSTLMLAHPALVFMKMLCETIQNKWFQWVEAVTNMGLFGAERPKPSILVSNRQSKTRLECSQNI